METRRIKLREVQKEDFPTLFMWRNTEKFRFLFHHNENIINYVRFCSEFSSDAAVRKFQYIIQKTDTLDLIGLTFVHSYSEKDNHCFLNLFLTEDYEKKGYGVDVFVLFCLFLLKDIGIRSLYVEAFSYNTFSIACIRRTGMIEVENLENKKLHDGKKYNILRFKGDSSLIPELIKFKEILSISKTN